MFDCFISESEPVEYSIPIVSMTPEQWGTWITKQTKAVQQWLSTINFIAKPGSYTLLPDFKGQLAQVVLIRNDPQDFWSFGVLSNALPKAYYHYVDLSDKKLLHHAALAWGLGAYQFIAYKKPVTKSQAKLVLSEEMDIPSLNAKLNAIYRVRDLINTPAEDLGPAELATMACALAKQFQASLTEICGEELKENYPAIYTVGRASARKPRLIDLRWGNPQNPKITLVGKGVCFDSGGLNIKSYANMLLMRKDMGGAANALGLAELIMSLQLPLRLRLLIPTVENVISGNAYKPGDIIKTRQGLSVEITNTDAEGRLILADALNEADSENPELLIDFSTLTGAARIALGTEISAFFTTQEALASDLIRHAEEEQDPIWRLPLYKPYQKLLESKWADMDNSGTFPYAGAITAALFLRAFVKESTPWVHFDFNAYNVTSRPGRPEGGEGMAILAILSYLRARYT